MRKAYALFIVIVVFLPLAFSAMTLTSIRPWILDRGFYERIISDERLYEGLLTEELPNRFNEEFITSIEQLPVSALSIALREVTSPDFLRTQSLNMIDQAFDYIEGRSRTFELTLDITSLKETLAGEDGTRFSTTLAAELPPCAADQQPIASGGTLTRCIPADGSVDAAGAQIAAALPAVLAAMPDQLVVSDQWYVRANWYDWFGGASVAVALDIAIVMIILTAAGAGLVGAYLGGDDLRGRLHWFSSAVFFPASLFLIIGLVLASPTIAGPISRELSAVRWGVQYSEAFREAVINVIVPVIQQVGNGFLLTGVVASAIALGLLVWSLVVPASGQRNPRIVQVPAHNP